MLFPCLALAFGATLCIGVYYIYCSGRKDLHDFTVPGTHVLWGHLAILADHNFPTHSTLHDYFAARAKEFDGTYRLHLPLWPVIPGHSVWHTSDVSNVEHILKSNFENYIKGPIFLNNMSDLLGDGIFNADGTLWSSQRKTASHEFSVSRFRDYMTSVFATHSHELLTVISNQVEAGEADSMDLQKLFSKYTLSSIADIAFGVDLGVFRDGQACDVPFESAFDNATHLSGDRWTRPFWWWEKLCGFKEERQLKAEVRIIDEFSLDIITKRRRLSLEALTDRCDLLSRFMQLQEKDGENDDKHLKNVVINFILAGRDTTSNALSWLFYSLGKNPDVEAKLRAEMARVLGDKELNYEMVKGFDFLHAVLTETLRLYPSVPSDPKYVVNDDVLPSGHKVLAGQQIAYNPFSMGRLESIWGPDAHIFNPERFLDHEGKFQKPSAFKFSAFQAGRRMCLGIDMAYLEMKMAVPLLLKNFKFELCNDGDARYKRSLTLPMANLRVKVTRLAAQ